LAILGVEFVTDPRVVDGHGRREYAVAGYCMSESSRRAGEAGDGADRCHQGDAWRLKSVRTFVLVE
jgi:hypothetical protein